MSQTEPQLDQALDADDPETIDSEDTRFDAVKPWDPGKIRITTKSFSLRDIVTQIEENEIDLSPDFQREYVWKNRQRTRLVESILLGIPLPAFYFNQGSDGRYQVVDGVQRLSTIALFMNDGHRLDEDDLEYLNDLHGRTYSELEPAASRRIRSTQIVVHVIEPQTPDEVKYDIFSRVNTLGSPLSAQEIRHAMSKSPSRDLLRRLVEMPEFDRATGYHYWRKDKESGIQVRDSGRMANRELALRFCAFRYFSEDTYRQFNSLDSYLIDFTHRLDGTTAKLPPLHETDVDILETSFRDAMISATEILGDAAFRRWPPQQQRRGPINRAVFEAQANALADHDLNSLLTHKEAIVGSFRRAFEDPIYLRSVTVGTGDPKAVAHRLQATRYILSQAIS